MRTNSASFAADNPAAVIHDFLSRTSTRRVIIVDRQRPIGVVSRASMLRWREYHALATRALLADLARQAPAAPGDPQRLLHLIHEIIQQATSLEDRLQTPQAEPLETIVATATRIQLLLEEGMLAAHRLQRRGSDLSTLATIVSDAGALSSFRGMAASTVHSFSPVTVATRN